MTKRFRFLTLAALLVLPLAACDEGETVAPAVTGSVTGAVTIDGTGQAGVTVTLNSGKTATTNSSGQYTIDAVPVGSYTVAITGQPADAAFPSTTQTATIATAGQVVTVNFAGSRIRTSSIIGAVTGTAGAALNGVTVTLSGVEARTAATAGAGQFSFTGLRAGAYTVAITPPAGQTCATPSAAVTLAAGESKVQNFTCTAASTGRISGILFIDENPRNGLYDGAALEDSVKIANIAVTLEGPTLGVTTTQQTTASGTFSFTNLAPGSYNVRVDAANASIAAAGLAYGGTAQYTVTIAAGGVASVNLPFNVISQTIKVYAFLGRDVSPAPPGISTAIPRGVAPVSGVIIDLYPTETDLNAGTRRLGRDTTDVNGETQFTFLRSKDGSPSDSTVADNIVFADYVSGPNLHTPNGEDQFEIRYNPRFQTGLAPDTFDLLNSRVNMAFDAIGVSGQPLAGWVGALWLNDTTATAVARQSVASNGSGRIVFVDTVGPASLPDTFFMRLSGTQAAAGGVSFEQVPVAQRGTVANKYLRWIHSGTTTTQDTVDVGDERVTLAQTSVMIRVYHERDDLIAGGPPRMTPGDNIENVDNIRVTLTWRQTGATVDSSRTITPQAVDGVWTFLNVPTNQTNYRLAARSNVANQVVLNDTTLTLGGGGLNGDFTGGTPNTMVCPLGALSVAECATFGFKYNNGQINGRVKASDSTGASGLIVTLSPIAGTIQGSTGMIDTTDAAGMFGFINIREGKYNLTLTPNATWGIAGGQANPIADTVQNNGDIDIKNFIVRRLDTSIQGVVVNDRDIDNVIDPAEALAGVAIQLYRNNSNTSTTAITLDTLVASTTTGANGSYTFNNLPEARYIVKAVQSGALGAIVTRRVDVTTGGHVDTTVVRTAAAATSPVGFEDMARTVGSTTPAALPYWNYPNSSVANNGRTHFTFLYNNNTATGVITNAMAAPVSGMSVTVRRCLTSNPAQTVKPPFGPAVCTSYYPNFAPITTTTNATGTFTLSNLQEGVYEVTPSPATAGLTVVNPTSRLFLQSGNGDIEKGDFSAS